MSIATTLKRTMAAPPKKSRKVLEGIIAVNKPQWASSAGALRDLQEHFAQSALFQPWLEAQRRDMIISHSKQKHIDRLKVKLGHGGTLDPMATGVLVVGIGKGTKCLQRFLKCTKTYECVVLFGAATDSYDAVGKIVSRAPYEHVTKELVQEKLAQFRGEIMQKPSVFSALKVDGKKLYEYAREGKDIPEVAARPVEVKEMELLEWFEPGTHEYAWPKDEADAEAKEGAEKLLGIRTEDASIYAKNASRNTKKRQRSPENDQVENAGEQPKRPKTDDEPAMSGALPAEATPANETEDMKIEELNADATATTPIPSEEPITEAAQDPSRNDDEKTIPKPVEPPLTTTTTDTPIPSPPAARLRMTVTSGFYVRSLCHDLGLACSSLGLMSSLIRTRQGDYTLGQNVVEMSDFDKGAEAWEPLVQKQLEEFMQKEQWEAEEVEEGDGWKERMEKRQDDDKDRSYRGRKGKNGGAWRGKGKGGGGNRYSKGMDGGRRRDG